MLIKGSVILKVNIRCPTTVINKEPKTKDRFFPTLSIINPKNGEKTAAMRYARLFIRFALDGFKLNSFSKNSLKERFFSLG